MLRIEEYFIEQMGKGAFYLRNNTKIDTIEVERERNINSLKEITNSMSSLLKQKRNSKDHEYNAISFRRYYKMKTRFIELAEKLNHKTETGEMFVDVAKRFVKNKIVI